MSRCNIMVISTITLRFVIPSTLDVMEGHMYVGGEMSF